ncbi:MAG: carbamoyl-phosphate synthase large subunit, partial [Gammaproteobacteria bacterium]|nr:carbamoyl-phosphate synthase large subunit [Gammaproteobacteria bacterium]
VKVPRWDIQKLKGAARRIGTEMKSVGEVMAIGRSFGEALQKALGMLNIGASGITDYPHEIPNIEDEIRHATDRRIFALYRYFLGGGSIAEANAWSHIDPWFLNQVKRMADCERELTETAVSAKHVKEISKWIPIAKKLGFSDKALAKILKKTEQDVRALRLSLGVRPVVKQIDTLAGEFDAKTNYLYMTYHGEVHDLEPSAKSATLILGSGPYSIGSSVEFDWGAVTTARTLRKLGEVPVMVNSNPETVSTDYDESDRLYFEQLSFERIQDILDFENIKGVIVSVGGQTANNLVVPLAHVGAPILGTSAAHIEQAENREKFSAMLASLGIQQPAWTAATDIEAAKAFAKSVGFPVLIRPSFVLSGAAMNVVFSDRELEKYLREATAVSPDYPVVVSHFIQDAKELEIDGVANRGEVVIEAISEHVENAGVHSGDATIVLPPQRLYLETIRQAKKMACRIVKALEITGPFNIQFLAKNNELQVIECNVRASRSFPFVSKVTRHNFIDIATRVLLGVYVQEAYETLELDYVGVKSPQFSYHRLKGANPVAGVEMASTGEVACLGEGLLDAFYRSWLATEQQVKGKRIFISASDEKKPKLVEALRRLEEAGWTLVTTAGTHDYLAKNGIASRYVHKYSEGREP